MKKSILALTSFFIAAFAFAQQRNCATMENLENRMEKDSSIQERMNAIESYTSQKLLNGYSSKVLGEIITIPVVVHVIYSNNTENISDAQILSQIEVLNEDFRRTNPDADNRWSVAADTQIEFQLASIDPNGNATTGITRKSSSVTEWGTNDAMKRTSQGGVTPWDTSAYLNMWVCNIGSNLLGYAQFPGGSAATDGVVMSPQYFGSSDKGNGFYLSAPFDKGRTTTHEVGHFLNLRHIWGDGNCNADDFVNDTPNADDANVGCASGSSSCGSVDMVENYMDYSDDSCMNLFTQGQTDRMRAVLEAGGIRRSLALSDKFGGATTPPEVTFCENATDSFPYTASFESSVSWTQSGNDDGDWLRDSNGTPSSNTGPSDAADGSFYLFLEASTNSSVGQIGSNATAILESDCLDFSDENEATINFAYHMYGDDIGSLSLQASTNGTTWVTLWSENGNEGNQWNTANISLAAYLNETVQLRFVGITGNGWSSDIAIDAISVTTTGDSNPVEPPITGTPDYCESNGNDASFEWIDFVSFAGISNSTGNNGGYADFTNQFASVAPGSTYQLVISAGFASTAYTEFWDIWIDYNQDGVFADSESLASGSSSSDANLSVDVSIPANASLGTTRMRVSMKYDAAQTACESFEYGEVEDYSVTITNAARRVQGLIANTTFLGNEAAASLEAYPNPAHSVVNVQLNTRDTSSATYRIANLGGQTLDSGSLKSTQINVSSLTKGLYILEVYDGQKTSITKIVKN